MPTTRPRPRLEGRQNPVLAFKGKREPMEGMIGQDAGVVPGKLKARQSAAKNVMQRFEKRS